MLFFYLTKNKRIKKHTDILEAKLNHVFGELEKINHMIEEKASQDNIEILWSDIKQYIKNAKLINKDGAVFLELEAEILMTRSNVETYLMK